MTTEEQRTKFTEQLTEMEDWLYMEGEAEGAVEFRARLKQVKDVGDPMKKRAQVQGGGAGGGAEGEMAHCYGL